MGQRGPVRNPNSRRGQAETRKRQKLAAFPPRSVGPGESVPASTQAGLPTCGERLPRRVREIYQNLVIDLAGAKVPIKQIDSHAITMAARCLASVEDVERMAGDGDLQPEQRMSALRLAGQFGKDLVQWLQLICATPGARARIGLRAPAEKKAGPLAQIRQAKQRGTQ